MVLVAVVVADVDVEVEVRVLGSLGMDGCAYAAALLWKEDLCTDSFHYSSQITLAVSLQAEGRSLDLVEVAVTF